VGLAQGLLGRVAKGGLSGAIGQVSELITGATTKDEERSAA
jgi:hypothetical protein